MQPNFIYDRERFYEDFLSAGVLFFNARAPVLSQAGYSNLSFVDGTT